MKKNNIMLEGRVGNGTNLGFADRLSSEFASSGGTHKELKINLKAEIDRDAWETLYRDNSSSFARPATGCFAVKVIKHFDDEVMKVFGV